MSRAGGDAIYRAEGTAKDETEDGKEGDVACKSEELVAGRETKRRDDDDAEIMVVERRDRGRNGEVIIKLRCERKVMLL